METGDRPARSPVWVEFAVRIGQRRRTGLVTLSGDKVGAKFRKSLFNRHGGEHREYLFRNQAKQAYLHTEHSAMT